MVEQGKVHQCRVGYNKVGGGGQCRVEHTGVR